MLVSVIGAGVLAMIWQAIQGAKERKRRETEEWRQALEAASLDRMARRDVVTRSVEREDYLFMPEAEFRTWLDLNRNSIFPHEKEAMERARKSKFETKPQHDQGIERKPDRLHPYQN